MKTEKPGKSVLAEVIRLSPGRVGVLNELDLDHRRIDQFVALFGEMDQVFAFGYFLDDAAAAENGMDNEAAVALACARPGKRENGIDDLAE